MSDDPLYREAQKGADSKIDFKHDLLRFVVVNIILFAINVVFSPNHWWFYWVTIIMAIVLVIKFLKIYVFADKFDGNKDKLKDEEMDAKVDFRRHAYRFVFVTIILFLINALFSPDHWWFYWVSILMGIVLLVKFLKAYVLSDR